MMMASNISIRPPCTNPCEGAYYFTPGIKGSKADLTKILLVANRADDRICQLGLFNHSHLAALLKSKTGRALQEILAEAGMSFEDVYFTNAFKCLLPGNKDPSRQEYKNCAGVLESQVLEFQPRKIVAFGRMAYESMFPEAAEKTGFENNVGSIIPYRGDAGCPTLISQHPSKLISIISKTRYEHYAVIANFLRH